MNLDDARLVAVDPSDLERGDEVIVKDVTNDGVHVHGTVEKTTIEWGRCGVTIVDGDGDGGIVWEETGRTWTRVDRDDGREDAPTDADRAAALEDRRETAETRRPR